MHQRTHQRLAIVSTGFQLDDRSLHRHRDRRPLRLHVGDGHVTRVRVLRNRIDRAWRASGLQAREVLRDQLLNLTGIDVAHDDDRHAAGTIVIPIELTEPIGWKTLEHFGCANRNPVDVSAVAEERLELRLLHSRARAETSSPFLDHDATLAIDLGAVHRDAAREITQRFEPARERARSIRGHVEQVYGLVEAGVRVHVRAKSRTDRLEIGDELTWLEVGAAVEGHVLEHVREPTLVVILVHRSSLDGQTQHRALLRPPVLTNEIPETVGKRAGLHGGVERQQRRRILRRPGYRRHEQQQGDEVC